MNSAWVKHAISEINADYQRSADTHLIRLPLPAFPGIHLYLKDESHIARALAQSPSEILLDEPTNHLDIHHQMQLMQLISELPVTSIVAIHDLNHAAMFCDSLIVMQQGQILASGTPEEILSEGLLWDVFRVKTKIEISPYHGKKHIHFIV